MGGKISVIVPVYNTEKYLEKCLYSLVRQTCEELEIILVDDGSEDRSLNICDLFADGDRRIKIIHKQNGGLSSARNAGLSAATGEYAAFVDSDDYIEKDMFSYLRENIGDADIAVCGYFTDKNGKSKAVTGFKEKTVLSRQEALKELFTDERLKNHVWNKLYKRELFDGISFPEGKTFEDILTTYRVFERAKSVTVLPLCKYHYLERENSISKKADAETALARFSAHRERYLEIKDRYSELDMLLLYKAFLSARQLGFALIDGETGAYEEGLCRDLFRFRLKEIEKSGLFGYIEKKQAVLLVRGEYEKMKGLELPRKAEKLLMRSR